MSTSNGKVGATSPVGTTGPTGVNGTASKGDKKERATKIATKGSLSVKVYETPDFAALKSLKNRMSKARQKISKLKRDLNNNEYHDTIFDAKCKEVTAACAEMRKLSMNISDAQSAVSIAVEITLPEGTVKLFINKSNWLQDTFRVTYGDGTDCAIYTKKLKQTDKLMVAVTEQYANKNKYVTATIFVLGHRIYISRKQDKPFVIDLV